MGLFNKKSKEIEILAPMDGEVIELAKVPDEIFAEKMMGDGFGIKPDKNSTEVVAPFDGELTTVFPTGHAYGIKHKSGLEVLIHIGLDTVSLEGEGFTVNVKQNDHVKAGDKLVDVDFKGIEKKVPSIISPIVFPGNVLDGKTLTIVKTGKVKKGDVVATVK